jgi:hypothetical protein
MGKLQEVKEKKVILTLFQKGERTPDNSKVTSKGATTFITPTFCGKAFRSNEFDLLCWQS